MSDYLREIQQGESLRQEFKSDCKSFPDHELIYEAVALANTEGGLLWLGIEDDGTITGLQAKHVQSTPASMIANRTIPPLSVHATMINHGGKQILRIEVPVARGLTGTSDGRYSQRRLKYDGTPESVPMTPYEIQQRNAYLGQIDPSAQPLRDIPLSAIDPLQRERMRATIRRSNHSDKSLLDLADEEFDMALGLVKSNSGKKYLTLAGALFLTSEFILRDHVPTHEVAFQVLQNTNVLVNEHTRKPLVEVFDDFELRFKARIEEKEFMDGLIRVHVPNYDINGFREAFINALVHRDYACLGTVIIKIDDNGLIISNPGGFVEGVTLQNLLTVEPKARNFALADIAKRIGLAERTGRGIDRIYEGVLRYGRPAPDYSRSSRSSISLFISDCKADFRFLELILEQEEIQGKSLPIDTLIIIASLREERRLTSSDLALRIQKNISVAHAAVEKLVERGLVDAHGNGRGRTYTLSQPIYKEAGKSMEYVRQNSFSEIQQPQMVMNLLNTQGYVVRGQVMELCHLSRSQAFKLLEKMIVDGSLRREGKTRAARYYASARLHPIAPDCTSPGAIKDN